MVSTKLESSSWREEALFVVASQPRVGTITMMTRITAATMALGTNLAGRNRNSEVDFWIVDAYFDWKERERDREKETAFQIIMSLLIQTISSHTRIINPTRSSSSSKFSSSSSPLLPSSLSFVLPFDLGG